jgi:uncharacterized membrane-anchored protein
MNRLASRKQLLLAESELNRAHMVVDMAGMAEGARALSARAKSFGLIVSSVATLVAGVAAYQRRKVEAARTKSSWPRKFMAAAGLVSTIWLALRSQDENLDPK